MSNDIFALILDVVVLLSLGATIFYVMRLTRSLDNFKKQRQEFDGVISNLLSSIDQAERSVQKLKQVGAQEAGNLEDLIFQSKALADELRIINGASESMAKRLEQLAEKNRKIAQASQQGLMGASAVEERPETTKISSPVRERRGYAARKKAEASAPIKPQPVEPPKPEKAAEEKPGEKQGAGYASTLRSVEKTAKPAEDIPSFMIQDRDYDEDAGALGGDDADEFQSEAERELFEALRSANRNIGGGN